MSYCFLTFDTCIGVACSTIFPFSPCFRALRCNFLMFTPSIKTRESFGNAFTTGPDLPLSLPVITITLSPFLIFMFLFVSFAQIRGLVSG